jgi:DtxR family transcriptional regulator, Mn-dependent transcriptional regulator
MSIRGMLSQSVEDYLKAIYKLQEEDWVSTSELANRLDVSAASVTNMVKRLATLGLVSYASYKGVRLTSTGEKIALEIVRHHRLLETYLREIMGYDWDEMHEEAEHLEHHISKEFEAKLDKMLGYPTHDPHGDPIPSRDGTIISIESEPISKCPQGIALTVRRVSDSNTEMLRELEAFGLLPGANVKVMPDTKKNGTMMVLAGQSLIEINLELASHVFASPTE